MAIIIRLATGTPSTRDVMYLVLIEKNLLIMNRRKPLHTPVELLHLRLGAACARRPLVGDQLAQEPLGPVLALVLSELRGAQRLSRSGLDRC